MSDAPSAERRVRVQRLPHAEGLPLPAYVTPGAAGMDVHAAVPAAAPLELAPGAILLIPTGLRLALPSDLEAQVRPRSGLALRHGVTVLNSPGTIDSDYRGELGVILVNHGPAAVSIRRGDRIAQLVVSPVVQVAWEETAESLEPTRRGEGGFGSTGGQGGSGC